VRHPTLVPRNAPGRHSSGRADKPRGCLHRTRRDAPVTPHSSSIQTNRCGFQTKSTRPLRGRSLSPGPEGSSQTGPADVCIRSAMKVALSETSLAAAWRTHRVPPSFPHCRAGSTCPPSFADSCEFHSRESALCRAAENTCYFRKLFNTVQATGRHNFGGGAAGRGRCSGYQPIR